MSKSEFISKAKAFGYSDDDINELIEITENARTEGVPMKYEDIVLVEQPQY